jgi:hypothetical protein
MVAYVSLCCIAGTCGTNRAVFSRNNLECTRIAVVVVGVVVECICLRTTPVAGKLECRGAVLAAARIMCK